MNNISVCIRNNLHIISGQLEPITRFITNLQRRRRLSNESTIIIFGDNIAGFDFTIILNVNFFLHFTIINDTAVDRSYYYNALLLLCFINYLYNR